MFTHTIDKIYVHDDISVIPSTSFQEETEKGRWKDVPGWKRAVLEKREAQRYVYMAISLKSFFKQCICTVGDDQNVVDS